MKKEVSQASFDDWYTFLCNYDYNRLGEIYYVSNNYHIEVPFAPNILPETSKAYVEILSKNSAVSAKELFDHCTGENIIDKYDIEINSIIFNHFDENGNYQLNYISINNTTDSIGKNLFAEGVVADTELDVQKDFFVIEFITGTIKDDSTDINYYFRNVAFLPATVDAYQWLCDNNLIK